MKLLKRFILTCLLLTYNLLYANLLVLDPGGHNENLGRKLKHGYERGASLKLCEKIKNLASTHSDVKTILARNAGEKRTIKQTISLANQLKPKLYIRVHVAHHEHAKPRMNVYYRKTQTLAQNATKANSLKFTPIDQSHVLNQSQAKVYGTRLRNNLILSQAQQLVDAHGPFGLPLNSLKGLIAPALLIEISSNDEKKIDVLAKHLAQSILKTISNENKNSSGQKTPIE